MEEILNQVLSILLVAIATGISGLITWGFVLLRAWISKKIKNEELAELLDKLTVVIESSVRLVNQRMVDELKKEGQFNASMQLEALNLAKTEALSLLTKDTEQLIEKHFGDVHKLIEELIEAQIATIKNR